VESWVKMRWPVKKKGWNGLGKLLTSLNSLVKLSLTNIGVDTRRFFNASEAN
jgi:hypothetical protein